MYSQGKTRAPTHIPVSLLTLPVLAIGLLLFVAACGGGGKVSGSTETPTAAPAAVQFRVGDAPSDRLVSVESSVTAIHLTDSKGNQVNVLPATRRLEFIHLAGTSEPVALLNIPQGTYTAVTLEGMGTHVSYLDASGWLREYQDTSVGPPMVVTLSPPITIGKDPAVVSADLDVASWITIDPTNNSPPVLNNPAFTFTAGPVGEPNLALYQEPESGRMEHVVGIVSGISGSSFTVAPGQNRVPLTFQTGSITEFEDVTLDTLPNMIVKVNGVTQPDGSLLATYVCGMENTQGVEAEGLVYWDYETAYDLWLIPQDGNGAGLANVPEPAFGQTLHLSLADASYVVNVDNVDMTGLTGNHFVFDWDHVGAGQRVMVKGSAGIVQPDPDGTDGLVTANKVYLEKQSVSGTVDAYSTLENGGAWFNLLIPSDSYLAVLNSPSPTAVTVWQQPGTHLHGITSIKNGDKVRVRGLLFRDGKGGYGAFNMAAQRISK